MDDETLRAALRLDSPQDLRLLMAIDAGAVEQVQADNDPWNAGHVWPRRVRHLAERGLLLDDADSVLADLRTLEADAEPFTVVNRRLAVSSGEEVFTVLLTGTPPRVRVAFAHLRPA